jgi:hypothetical protein
MQFYDQTADNIHAEKKNKDEFWKSKFFLVHVMTVCRGYKDLTPLTIGRVAQSV